MRRVPHTRRFEYRDRGEDVEAVGRALCRAGVGIPLVVYNALPRRVRRTWGRRKQRWLRTFKRRQGLPPDAIYGPRAHARLSPYFDARDRSQMKSYRPRPSVSEAEIAWRRLLEAMREVNGRTSGYLYGAGHGVDLDGLDPTGHFDCSSSTSYVLRRAGLFPDDRAWVSGKYAQSYGEPGRGRYFTVYANDGHVWIRLHRSRWWRFDTSPYGDPRSPRSGPRLRYLPRLTWGFAARRRKGV